MNLPNSPVFSPQDFPDTDPNLLAVLTRAFLQLRNAAATVQTRANASGDFTSAASGVSAVSVQNQLPAKPQQVNLNLRKDDLTDFAAAWSWWWAMDNELIKLSFIGLPASTKLVYSVEMF